ncbi:hypothetical protein SARC_18291, partial [Sphaeroforma arctica JP610]
AGSIANSLKIGLAMINSEFQNNKIKKDLDESAANEDTLGLNDDNGKEEYGLLGNVEGCNVIIM